ncbi:MAG: hypothetical protein NTV51_27225 [Verrucomicrobia bacterium]|nr:hypothetical protein [Verrucomicrobiota bacterium]
MTSFPTLSYVCPIRWEMMRGDERERYCSQCSRTVVNVSLLTTAERQALLANPPPGGLCVAYYQRLSGECVSAETPLTASESRRVVQWGAIAASAATLAAAAHFAPEINASLTAARGPASPVSRVAQVCDELKEQGKEVLYDLGVMKRPAGVTMMVGMMVCPTPSPAPSSAPGSAAPAPAPPSAAGTTPAPAPAAAPTPFPADQRI